MRITQVAIDMAKRMKTKDEELVKFQEVSEHQLSELQGRIDELHSELNEKRRHIALLNVDDRVQKSRIDALESDTHRLQSELSASKRLCAELKKELEERKEINLELTTDLKWKENEVNMTKVSLTGMEEELKKGEREKRKLEESVEMLRDHLAHAEHLAQLLETENHDLARTVRDLKDNVDEISSHTNAITHGSSLSYLATSKVPMRER
ncbi:hypothetical protein BC829DRAFT_84444 [Chytridium lagenaria]|nr:hypothetical protein BC829DRAFT_84444 [Chytridium lagenaria]